MSRRKRSQQGNSRAGHKGRTIPAPGSGTRGWRVAAAIVLIAAVGCAGLTGYYGRRRAGEVPPPHPAVVAAAPAKTGGSAFAEDPELAAYRVAAEQNPNAPGPSFQLAWALYNKQRYTEAIPIMDHVIAMLPDGKVYDLRGAARVASDHSQAGLEAAQSDFKHAIQQYPNWFQPHEDLGEACFSLGRWNDAAAELEKAVALAPKQRHDYYDLMKAYRHIGLNKKADAAAVKFAAGKRDLDRLHELENICTAQPGNTDAFRELGLLEVKQAHYTIAIQLLNHAIRVRPQDTRLQDALHHAEAEWKRSDIAAFGPFNGGGL